MNNTGVTGLTAQKDFDHARGPRNSAYAVNLTYGDIRRATYRQCILEKWFPLQGERNRSSKIERRGRQNKNNMPINLPNVITFSTDFKYTTQS